MFFRRKRNPVAPVSVDKLEAITAHIERHLGPISVVFHEKTSNIVHIDVHVVPPNGDNDCYRLVTSGMSDLPMAVPGEIPAPRHLELMVSLPPDWKLDYADFNDETWYWPIRALKGMARFPHEHKTWLGPGHTVENGEAAVPYAPSTELCAALILPSTTAPDDFECLPLQDGTDIHFFALYFLYPEELTVKMEQGMDALLNGLDESDVTDIVDIRRPRVV